MCACVCGCCASVLACAHVCAPLFIMEWRTRLQVAKAGGPVNVVLGICCACPSLSPPLPPIPHMI